MDQNKLRKGCAVAVVVYLLLAIGFYFISGDQLHYRDIKTDMLSNTGVTDEITADTVITQKILPKGKRLNGVSFLMAAYGRQNTGTLQVELLRGEQVLDTERYDIASIVDNSELFLPVEAETDGEALTLRITAPESSPGNAVSIYYGSTMHAARNEVSADLKEDEKASVNGRTLDGALCVSLNNREYFWIGDHYWQCAAVGLLLFITWCAWLLLRNKAGENTLVTRFYSAVTRYSYLIKQLVARDFKTKYKRSVLGVLWSFLNPLLTMSVQYVVFSTLFRSNIPNFALYLLIGIVCFSFFSEATSLTLTSIIGNAPLITKVYVPKYIYPLTRVMSSTINFLLALIPLIVVMIVTRTPVRPAILLIPLPIFCLFALNLGIGMVLASSMVFFRDTQFLWGVLSMLWMYATPIFYPESILPANLMPLFKCNPLYHIIRFLRVVLMDGVSPEPKAYVLMLIVSLVPLAFGALVFRKTQDRFVFNI